MNQTRAKYQRRNMNTSTQPQESEKPKETRRATTTIIETKIERPYSRKVVEQRVEMSSDPSNNNFGRMPKTMGRYSAIISNKRNHVVTISTSNRENSLDKYKRENKEKENDNKYASNTTKNSTRPNYRWSVQVPEQKVEKEPVKWKRFSRVREEEKPKQEDISNRPIITSKTVKEEKTEKTPKVYTSTRYTKTTVVETKRNSRNQPDEKVVKTEVHVVTRNENPKEIENKKENNNEPKASYRSRRNQYRVNKTDEDLPPKKEEKEKEDIKNESRKRKTFETVLNPYSRNLKDMKIEQNTDNKNDNEKIEKNNTNSTGDNSNNNKRGYNYYNNSKIEPIDNNKINNDNDNDKNNNEDINDNNNTDNNNYKYKSYKNENPDNSNNNKYQSYNNDNSNNTNPKYRAAKTEPSDDAENNFTYKSYSKITKKDGNKKVEKEETIEENINEPEPKNRLKKALNEIEKVCAERTLKNDLKELFNKVLENNMKFKDNIFFRNLNATERKVGDMDKVDNKRICHTYREIETSEVLSNIENANDLLNKYTQRAKTIDEEY